jgi:cytochrome b subunit of formate dehydrogenase
MDKAKTKFWVDLLLFLDFLALAISGFVLKYALPRGSGRLLGENTFLGLLREDWLSMHNVTAVLIVIFILIHLLLNWAWIKNMFLCSFKNNKKECEVEEKNGKRKSKPKK